MSDDAWPDPPRDELEHAIDELLSSAQEVLETGERLGRLHRATSRLIEQADARVLLQVIAEESVALSRASGAEIRRSTRTGSVREAIAGALAGPVDLVLPLRVRGSAPRTLLLHARSAHPLDDEDSHAVSALADTASAALENARLFELAATRQRWTERMVEITGLVLAADASERMDVLVGQILRDSPSDGLVIAELAEDGAAVAVASGGARSAVVAGTVIAVDHGPPAVTRGSDRVAAADQRAVSPRVPEAPALPEIVVDGVVGPSLWIRLTGLDGGATLAVLSRPPGGSGFDGEVAALAAELAERLDLALQLARARDAKQHAKVVEERDRIARELHDHVVQQLFATGLGLQSLADRLPAGALREHVEDSVTSLDDSIAALRSFIYAAAPRRRREALSARHLVMDVATETTSTLPSPVRIVFDGPVDLFVVGALLDDVAAVVRETLSNVVRHADAEHATVDVALTDDELHVVTTDDGRGMGEADGRSGLVNLAERAARRGGDMRLESGEAGTVVRWSVPIPVAPDREGGR